MTLVYRCLDGIRDVWSRTPWARLRARIQCLENQLAALAGDLAAAERERVRQRNAVARQIVEHHAWLAALVELQQANPERHRRLLKLHAARLTALTAPTPAPETAMAVTAPPAAAAGGA